MSTKLKRNAALLHTISKSKPAIAKHIMKTAPNDVIDCIGEVCQNLLRSNIPVSEKYKKRLRRKRKAIRKIADKKTSRKAKRKTIQTGGILPLLGPLLGAVATPLLESITGLFK